MKHPSEVALDQHCDWRVVDDCRTCAPNSGKGSCWSQNAQVSKFVCGELRGSGPTNFREHFVARVLLLDLNNGDLLL